MSNNFIQLESYMLDPVNACLLSVFNGHLVYSHHVHFDFDQQDKPFYLSLLMGKKHLDIILENRSFFDSNFIRAAECLLEYYEKTKIIDDDK